MPWYFSCKSHWFCGLVQIHPQDVVVFILNTATESGWLSPWDPPLPWGKVHEEFTAPQHTRFILPPFHLDKILRLYCVGGIFLFWELVRASPSILLRKTVPLLKKPLGLSLLRYACKRKPYLENFISRPSVIPAFQTTPLHKQGQELRSEQTVTPLHKQRNSLLIFAS